MTISLIVAMARNRAIGINGSMPWHLPEDLAHFKAITTGHTIIMGRKTFESLPNGVLPHRRNIIVSRTMQNVNGAEVFASLEQAIAACKGEEEVFVIGGGEIFRQAIPMANKLYITEVDTVPKEADTFFPEIDRQRWVEIKKEKHTGFSFITYVLR